jgi:tetratricopeptide (TPR) repeat protein
MQQGISHLQLQLKSMNNDVERAQLLVKIGAYYRVISQFTESEHSLREAIVVFQKHKMHKMFWAAQLRLAATFQIQQKIKDAEEIYSNYTKQLETPLKSEISTLADYAYFYIGLLNFRTKQYEKAINYLVRALELRLVKGDIDSIQQTQDIINMAREKLDNQT